MPRSLAVLFLAALLLSPVAAPAQTSRPAKVPPRSVSLYVQFVAASVPAVDSLGIDSVLFPLSVLSPQHQVGFVPLTHSFRYATGIIVPQLYETLKLDTSGRNHRFATFVTTSENLAATIVRNDEIPVVLSRGRSIGTVHIQGSLSLTAHINPHNLVNLNILFSDTATKPVELIAVPSGETVMVMASNAGLTTPPYLGGLFQGLDKMPATQRLLIFITPTIIPLIPDNTGISILP